ncbi:MAG: hypothetical protein K0S65_6392, partial [Labilithrix sp.]|nr:hypothetical protein [Labilithrix sp.]
MDCPILRRSTFASAWLVVGLGTSGCQGATYAANSGMWVRLGDASIAADPGRAVADYEKAKQAHAREERNHEASDVAVAEIDRKLQDAATRWLLANVAAQKPPTTESEARKTLGYVSATRLLGERYKVKDRLGPPLASLEAVAYQKFWEARRSAATQSPFEKLASLVVAHKGLPPSATAMSSEANTEIRRQRDALVAKYTRDVEAAGSHAGARYLRRKLLEAAKQTPGTFAKADPPAEIVRAGRITWKTMVGETNCDGIGRAFDGLRASNDGEHKGSLRLVATCLVQEGK